MSALNSRANRDLVTESGLVNYAVKFNFEIAKEEIRRADYSTSEFKELTFDIMSAISSDGNVPLMNTIAKSVRCWKNDKTIEWKSSLCTYARSRDDIVSIYVGRNEFGNEFIVVADDVTSDEVLEHNDFCFELADVYTDISNFMVLDEEEFECMHATFEGYRKIYQRG